MSDVEMEEQPRRSGRQRKVPETYGKDARQEEDDGESVV
jgi:hypothetical protein